MRIILACTCLILAGCITKRPVISSERPVLYLEKSEKVRTAWGFLDADVVLPPGDYIAKFEDEHGTFYSPLGAMLFAGLHDDRYTVQVKDQRAVGVWYLNANVIYPLERPVPMLRR